MCSHSEPDARTTHDTIEDGRDLSGPESRRSHLCLLVLAPDLVLPVSSVPSLSETRTNIATNIRLLRKHIPPPDLSALYLTCVFHVGHDPIIAQAYPWHAASDQDVWTTQTGICLEESSTLHGEISSASALSLDFVVRHGCSPAVHPAMRTIPVRQRCFPGFRYWIVK